VDQLVAVETCGSVECLSKFPFVHDERVDDEEAARYGDGVGRRTVRQKQDH
jgi:hypothetical protein